MKPKFMSIKLGTALLALAVTPGIAVAVTNSPANSTAAEAVSAMDACKAGKAPDAEQTVFLSGTNGRASYPRGVTPDNAVFPGDVVRIEISGRLRYNATRWTGPAGTGTPDANGIRPYAATATWNNLPTGRVGPPMPAVDLRGCTEAPPKLGVRLLYGIKDKDLTDNGGGFTITTKVWKAPGRLTIDRTEVTQGVQDRNGRVALISKKRTFVRVFFHHEYDGSTRMPDVTGTLRVPGLGEVVRPLVNARVTSLTSGDDPRTLENSLLFEVPAAALGEGSRRLVVTVRPPADRGGGWSVARQVPVEFGPTTRLRVIGVRYSYHNVPEAMSEALRSSQPGLDVRPGWWQARTLASWEPMRRMAENALPLARLTIADDAPAGSTGSEWGSARFDCEAGQRPDGLWYCGGYEDAITWSKKYADELCPDGGCLLVLLQPESQLTGQETGTCFCVSFGHGTPLKNSVINLQGERDPADRGNTLAHELGHYLGLPHTWDDPHFDRRDDALLGDVIALRYTPAVRLLSQGNPDGTNTYELMTYRRPAWFSRYNYCKAMHAIPGRHPVCHPGWDR